MFSTGKTYTIVGTPDQPGIIPRALEYMFRSLPELPEVPEIKPLPSGEVQFLKKENYQFIKHRKSAILSAASKFQQSQIGAYK